MIEVIAFDFGGVLGGEANEWETTFKEVTRLTALSNAEIQEIWNKYWPKLKTGKKDIAGFWKAMAKKNNADYRNLRLVYNKGIRIDNEVFDVAKHLSKKYKLIILSNDTKDWMDAKVKRFGLKKIFQRIYNSADIGFAKPADAIFNFVLNDQNIKPEELVFIDNQENNFNAASKLGIKAILFKNVDSLLQQLSRHGIEV